MVDNPLFPGYKQRREGEILNPLFPGYQSGGRPYKPPKNYSYIGKFEFDGDAWLQQLDEFSMDAGEIPKWFWERYISDFKDGFKASYNPEAIPVELLDDYDRDVLPGVSDITLTLDPTEWKEPKKVLEKTAKSWIKAGTGLRFKSRGWGLEAWPIDFTDYDNRIKTTMWKAAMGIQEDISDTGMVGAKAIASATRARFGDNTYGDSLFNFKDANYVVTNRNAYKVMAFDAVEAQRFIQGGPKRDKKHDSFAGSLNSAINEEINGLYVKTYAEKVKRTSDVTPVYDYEKQKATGSSTLEIKRNEDGNKLYTNIKGTVLTEKTVPVLDKNGNQVFDKKGNPLFEDVLFESKVKSRRDLFKEIVSDNKDTADNFEKAAKIFQEKQSLAYDMGGPATGQALYGPFGITVALKARVSGSKSAEFRWDTPDVPGGSKTRFEAKMDSLKDAINERVRPGGDIDSRIAKIRAIDPKSAEAVQKYADQYKDYLLKVQDALNTYDGNDRLLLNKLSAITVNGKGLTDGGLLDPSIQRGLLRQIESDLILPGRFTKVDKRYQIGTYLKDLERQAASGTDKTGKTIAELFTDEGLEYKGFFANQARIVASRIEMDRSSYAVEEFYDAITEGRFMERYVWNRLAKKLTGYTPGEIVQKTLANVGYLGLSIDDTMISEKLRNSETFNKVFRHKFKLKIDNEDGIFSGAGKLKEISLFGSKDLAAVGTLGFTLENVKHLDEESDLLKLLTGKVRFFIPDPSDPTKTIKNMGIDSAAGIQGIWDKVPGFWNKDEHHLRVVQNEIDNFRKWLAANAATLGITLKDYDLMSDIEKKQMVRVFQSLNKENKFYGSLKITKEFSGALQRIGMGLNKLQDKVFGSDLVKKLVRPLMQAKTIISEKVSEAVAKLVSKLLTKGIDAATGGATAAIDFLIEKALKPIIRFVTRKIIEFGQNFVGALAQGDFSRAIAQMEKEAARVVKFSMYVFAIPFVLLFAMITMLGGVAISTYSPVDPTRGESGYTEGYNVGFPEGENDLVSIVKNVQVDTDCLGLVITNPSDTFPNDCLPLRVKYTLDITPKVDLEPGTLYYSDLATLFIKVGDDITEDNFLNLPKMVVPGDYVAGETITVELSGWLTVSTPDTFVYNLATVYTPEYEEYLEDQVTYSRFVMVGDSPFPTGCFVFSGFWPDPAKKAFEEAILTIGQRGGDFYQEICGAGQKYTLLSDSNYKPCLAERLGDVIHFGIVGCNILTPAWSTFWLAHEAMHLYQGTDPQHLANFTAYNSGKLLAEISMPTYFGHSDGLKCYVQPGCDPYNMCEKEDMAESWGNYFTVNRHSLCWGPDDDATWGSSDSAFWLNFPQHMDFNIKYVVGGVGH